MPGCIFIGVHFVALFGRKLTESNLIRTSGGIRAVAQFEKKAACSTYALRSNFALILNQELR